MFTTTAMLHKLFSLYKASFVCLLVVVTAIFLWGCASSDATVSSSPTPEVTNMTAYANLPRLKGKATVEMTLDSGKVIIEVDGDSAPITAGNFIDLVRRGFYDGLTFHRVVKQPNPFVVQGGDPLGNGTGGFSDPQTATKRTIPLEILPAGANTPVYGKTLEPTQVPKLRHDRGAVAMARSQLPDSASSQFYIALDNIYFLDGSYAVFGYVKSGMELVDKIKQGDRIVSMKVIKGLDGLELPKA